MILTFTIFYTSSSLEKSQINIYKIPPVYNNCKQTQFSKTFETSIFRYFSGLSI